MQRTSASVFGSTRMYEIVNRLFGMYCSARLYVVYSVGTPNRPLDATLAMPDDHTTVVVDFEGRADRRVLELGELGVLDGEKAVLGEDIFDVPFEERRATEQARVVEAEDGDP